jgi:hypothetical protein
MITLGQVAYESYCRVCGVLPFWASLPSNSRDAWERASVAVLEFSPEKCLTELTRRVLHKEGRFA